MMMMLMMMMMIPCNLCRQNDRKIDKRCLDTINKYIEVLSAMVPTCHAMSSKPNK